MSKLPSKPLSAAEEKEFHKVVNSIFRKDTVAQLGAEAQRPKPSTEVLSDCAGLDQIPLSALQRIGTIFAEGERKYGRDNWRNDPGDVEYRRERTRHALRHFRRWIEETEGHRPATGEDHLAKVAWFCVTTMERQRALSEEIDY